MAPRVQHKRSAVKGKAPQPSDLEYGEIGVNYEASDPALYVRDSSNAIRKISPQVDATTLTKGVVQLATGAEVTTGTDAVKAVTPATLKTELDKKANQATTYTKTETDTALALKADLASPSLTGTPTAPTAAAGTNTTQLATTAFVTAAVAVENLWDRTGTVVSPTNAGDVVSISAGTAALPGLTPVGDTNTGIYAPAADTVAVSTNGTEKVRITSDGYLRMAAGSKGIQFGGDTAAANALNDYEEGTFTPTIVGLTTNGTGTYGIQIGRYTKIGNAVSFYCRIAWSAHTGTGAMRIGGLPFTSANVANAINPCATWYSNLTSPANTVISSYVMANGTQVVITDKTVAGGPVSNVLLDTAADLAVSGTYFV